MLNIALNTFREIIRNRFLYMIVFFALLFIGFSIVIGKLTIGDDAKVVVDFGLAMIEIFSFVGVLFIGSQLLFKEIDGKTIFLILSKPIDRWEFIVGKFIGFSLVISFVVLLQSILFIIVVILKDIELSKLLIFAVFSIFIKMQALIAIVIFLSTFMSTMITILVSVMIYFVSHSFSLVIAMAIKSKSIAMIYTTKTIAILFPPFEAVNIKDYIGSLVEFSNMYLLANIGYMIIYTMFILFLSVLIFNKKTFEN